MLPRGAVPCRFSLLRFRSSVPRLRFQEVFGFTAVRTVIFSALRGSLISCLNRLISVEKRSSSAAFFRNRCAG